MVSMVCHRLPHADEGMVQMAWFKNFLPGLLLALMASHLLLAVDAASGFDDLIRFP